ncbi:homoserine dehydrogenase [Bordetella ansorpii]|uniref:Homoserine dehydrogenase n=2 Tax=Bordetella ansorpii TaxID=288768 RepID=A0A157QAT6_9BORD|nr:homoserine dehydrogenase [Bordetella ansorpii]
MTQAVHMLHSDSSSPAAQGMQPMRVGLLGLGVVGGGTWTVLARNAEEIARRAGRRIEVARIAVRDVEKARSKVGEGVEVSTDGHALVRDPRIDIVVELIGGDTLARELVLEAIAQGKHVVTANKALLAKHGNEIFAAASERGVMVAFEAAVAGGIPIIKAIREGLTANRIQWVAGIINGTTNFILSEMRSRGLPFADVLAEAQRLGYAEADPTFDVEGVDAAHKLTLLASLAFGVPVQFDRAYIEGISQLAQEDISHAERLGYRIKLLGITKRRAEGIELRVHPALVPAERLLANVEGAMNAVLVRGDAVGPTLYYGQGAGEEPTASAVVADLVDVTRLHTADPGNRVPHLAFQPDALSDVQILPIEQVSTSYYLRVRVDDQPGVLADIARVLADRGISIGSMIQQPSHIGGADLIFLTHEAREGDVDQAIAKIEATSFVRSKVTRLRVEHLS